MVTVLALWLLQAWQDSLEGKGINKPVDLWYTGAPEDDQHREALDSTVRFNKEANLGLSIKKKSKFFL